MPEYKYVATTKARTQSAASAAFAQITSHDGEDGLVDFNWINIEDAHEILRRAHASSYSDSTDDLIDAKNELMEYLESLVGAPEYPELELS